MDYEKLAQELITCLRGRRSQAQLSRRLGYQSNVVNGWEHGRRYPMAHELFRLRSVDLDSFRRGGATTAQPVDVTTADGVAQLLAELRGKIPINELAARMGRSRFVVSRWIRGKTKPRLPDFLHLIDAITLRLIDFVALFVRPERLSTTAHAHEKLSARRRISRKMPWAQAVLHAIELDEYTGDAGWLAQRAGLTLQQEEDALAALHASGQIAKRGGRWVPVSVDVVDTRPDPAAGRQMRRWCTDAARQRLGDDGAGLFSYNLFTVSADDLGRIRQLHLEYFRALRAIVASSGDQEKLVIANVQLFELGA